MPSMKGINAYFKELSLEEIQERVHRNFVGGLWDEIGKLQFDFLIKQGLKASDNLLDVGCGCLRGGIHFIDYLEKNNYCGLDINKSLIEAGKFEIDGAGLMQKEPLLIVDDNFNVEKFQKKFKFAISVSLFTHLPINMIVSCLNKVRENLAINGKYYSTFFESPYSAYLDQIIQQPGDVKTNYTADPFHYSREEITLMARLSALEVDIIGDWGHPRNQKMAVFSLPEYSA